MAVRNVNEFSAFMKTIDTGFKYNLQTFPDTFTAASFLFGLLFQSPPLIALTTAIVLLNFIQPPLSDFINDTIVGRTTNASAGDLCSGRFRGLPGVSFESLLGNTSTAGLDSPSYYTVFLGFIAGYLGILPMLYARELEASPRRKAFATAGSIALVVLILGGILYRVWSGCDDVVTIFAGLGGGLTVGLLFVGFFAWISDRRLTNILGFPLIREKAPDGKPIYVCERK